MGSEHSPGTDETLAVSGELDVSSVGDLQDRIMASNAAVVRIDVAAVTFIDSTGLAGLLDAQARIEADGRHLKLANCPPVLTRLLEITALTDHFDGARPDPR